MAAESAEALLDLAEPHYAARRWAEAAMLYRRAIAAHPAHELAWFQFGFCCLELDRYAEAADAFERSLTLSPAWPGAEFNLGKALFELGEIEAAIRHLTRAMDRTDENLYSRALGTIACIAPGHPGIDAANVQLLRRCWTVDDLPVVSQRLPLRPGGGKLKIGYVSSFFGARNWMKPVWGVVNAHDRSRFEIHLFADGAPPDAGGGYRDRDEDHIHLIEGVENARVAEIVRQIGIDVLVDLNGYSKQGRLGLFARVPAPVAIGWFNYYATSGLRALDYLIGDAAVLPPDEEGEYVERILRVPGTYLAFSVDYAVPPVVPGPAASGAPLVFGSLCSSYKLTRGTLEAWAAILREAPDSILVLRNALLDDAGNRARLLRRFAAAGGDAERVRLAGRAPHYEFLETYGSIDVALDPFPYGGGTTTTEALWQGVPVLAIAGDRWAARTARSLLEAAGLGEWVASDPAAYVRQAVALARDPATPARLAELRRTMRERLAASPACDTVGLCRAIEAHYLAVSGRSAMGAA